MPHNVPHCQGIGKPFFPLAIGGRFICGLASLFRQYFFDDRSDLADPLLDSAGRKPHTPIGCNIFDAESLDKNKAENQSVASRNRAQSALGDG